MYLLLNLFQVELNVLKAYGIKVSFQFLFEFQGFSSPLWIFKGILIQLISKTSRHISSASAEKEFKSQSVTLHADAHMPRSLNY